MKKILSSEITPYSAYINRRKFIKLAGLLSIAMPITSPVSALHTQSTTKYDNQLEETLSLCSRNKYGLTGSIFTNSLKNIQLSDEDKIFSDIQKLNTVYLDRNLISINFINKIKRKKILIKPKEDPINFLKSIKNWPFYRVFPWFLIFSFFCDTR